MELSLVFLVIVLFLGFVVLVRTKSPELAGKAGESRVNKHLEHFLDKETYHLFKNVTLPTRSGSTQIDHIIVSKYGVFVIETKNIQGWIFGNPDHKIWTQVIYKYKSKFQNPLRQNYKHTKTLEDLLGLNRQQIHSVIVFVRGEFRTPMPENVTDCAGCIAFIQSKTRQVLSEDRIKVIINEIETVRLTPSFKTNRDHVKHVRNIKKAS